MPLNLIKVYPHLLDIIGFNEHERNESLKGVFRRDIENNVNFKFLTKTIRPIKKEGEIPMATLFSHLTTREIIDEKGKRTGARSFEMARSQRLHWVKYHMDQRKTEKVDIFSFEDKIVGRGYVIRTYIYDIDAGYVIILEPQKSTLDYFLITAYHLDEPGGKKQIESKRKKKLAELY